MATLPGSAFALPTPDVLIGTATLLPALLSVLVALLSFFALRLLAAADHFRNPREALARIVVGLSIPAALGAGLLTYSAFGSSASNQIAELAAYYRCDLAAHDRLAQGTARPFFRNRARPTSVAEIKDLLRRGADPTLIFVGTALQFASGTPIIGGQTALFARGVSNVFSSELERILKALPEPKRRQPVVVINPPAWMSDEGLKVLNEFADVRTLATDCVDDACLRDLEGSLFVDGNSSRLATLTPESSRKWPVALETWLYDESAVQFSGLTHLLTESELRRALADTSTWVIVPFSTTLRSLEVTRYYADELLNRRSNVILIDFDSPSFADEIELISRKIDLDSFMIAALTKYDWMYFGTDVAFEIHRRNSAAEFLGSSMSLAEHKAMTTTPPPRVLRKILGSESPFRLDGAWLTILALALAARLLTLPLAWADALRAATRRDFERAPFLGIPDMERWVLGSRRAMAVAGQMVSLVLIGALWPVLTGDWGPLNFDEYPWLRESSLSLGVALGVGIGARHWYSNKQRPLWVHALVIGSSVLVGALIPASVSVFAVAFLALGTPISAGAEWMGRRRIRATLPGEARSFPVSGNQPDALAIASLADFFGPGKAGRLGQLSRMRSALFQVPPGFVVSGELLTEFEQAARAGLEMHDLREPFIVRSAARGEDSSGQSQAGAFLSIPDVRKDGLGEAIRKVAQSYGRTGRVEVIVQTQIAATRAGVAFSRSPRSPAITLVESGLGMASDRLSGSEAPVEHAFSWVSTESDPAPSEVRIAALVSRLLEGTFGAPQDVEWVFDGLRFWVVQSRDALPMSQTVWEEQQRIAELLGASRGKIARSVALPEFPSPLAASIVERAYTQSFDRAAQRAHAPTHVTSFIAFGRLYERSAYRFRFGRSRRALSKELQRIEAEITSVRTAHSAELDGSDTREIHTRLLRFTDFVSEVSFEASLWATMLSEGSEAWTTTHELFAGLAGVARGESPEAFVARFGHRASDDYELRLPSFRENREALMSYARQFAFWPTSTQRSAGDVSSQSLVLKENAKDAAIACLRALRPAIIRLGERLDFDPFELHVEDFARSESELPKLAAARQKRREELSQYVLPENPQPRDFERLTDASGQGRLISGVKLEGTVSFEPPEHSGSTILVVPALSNLVVPQLSRVAGVVAEVGGALSHPALVARELGVPVFILAQARARLRDGDHISVDAAGRMKVTSSGARRG